MGLDFARALKAYKSQQSDDDMYRKVYVISVWSYVIYQECVVWWMCVWNHGVTFHRYYMNFSGGGVHYVVCSMFLDLV